MRGMTVADLATKLDVKAKDVLKKLLERRLMMTINSTLDDETASMVAREFGADVKMQSFEEEMLQVEAEDINPADLVTRGPVVTVMREGNEPGPDESNEPRIRIGRHGKAFEREKRTSSRRPARAPEYQREAQNTSPASRARRA